MRKILSIVTVLILVVSASALAKGGQGGSSDNSAQGPHNGPERAGDQNPSDTGNNPNDSFGGPNHGHEDAGDDSHGAPNSGDGVPDGSGW